MAFRQDANPKCAQITAKREFTVLRHPAKMLRQAGRVAELADAKDLGSFGAILAGSIPVAPTNNGFVGC